MQNLLKKKKKKNAQVYMYKHPGSKLHKTYKYVYKYIKVNLE